MPAQDKHSPTARFDLHALARTLPPDAETLLVDMYLAQTDASSARIFRVYRGTPAHYHTGSDEYLYVLSGRGSVWLEDPAKAAPFAPGHLLFFRRGIVHALPEICEEPVVFLAIDTPARDPADIIFINPADGTPESFIKQNS